MSSNICGNCANFKPKPGEKLFNCTVAQMAGVKYAMQVRADTRSCEAFSPLKQPQTSKPPPKPPPPTTTKRAQPPPALCNWGRLILIAAIIIIILLIAFGAYSCFSHRKTSSTTPTPTPTAAPTPTGIHLTPTPTPTPVPVNYYSFGDLVTSTPLQVTISQAQWATTFNAPGPQIPPAGSIFLLVPVTVWNVGNVPFTIAATDFQLVSAIGATYGAVPPPSSINFHTPFTYYSYTIQPSGYVTGVIIYTPPTAATDLSIRIFFNGQYLAWNVPPQ